MIHTVKDFGVVNKAEVDVFLELSCFFYDPMDVGNAKVGSQELPGVTGKFDFRVKMKQGQGKQSFAKRMH